MDYANAGVEPLIEEMLNDPIVRLLRSYDGLDEPEDGERSGIPPSALLRAA